MEQAEKLAQEVKLQMEYEHQKKLEQEQRERSGGRRSKRHSDPKSIIPFGKSSIQSTDHSAHKQNNWDLTFFNNKFQSEICIV